MAYFGHNGVPLDIDLEVFNPSLPDSGLVVLGVILPMEQVRALPIPDAQVNLPRLAEPHLRSGAKSGFAALAAAGNIQVNAVEVITCPAPGLHKVGGLSKLKLKTSGGVGVDNPKFNQVNHVGKLLWERLVPGISKTAGTKGVSLWVRKSKDLFSIRGLSKGQCSQQNDEYEHRYDFFQQFYSPWPFCTRLCAYSLGNTKKFYRSAVFPAANKIYPGQRPISARGQHRGLMNGH